MSVAGTTAVTAAVGIGVVLALIVVHELGRIADSLERLVLLANRRDDRELIRHQREAAMFGGPTE